MPKKHSNDALTLSSLALDYLGLRKQPFESSTLSDDAIFTDATLDQLLETTKHHLQFSDLLLIIEGKPGSGKTTLLQRILQSDISNTCLLSIHAETTDTLAQIQQKISLHLKDQGEENHLNDKLKNLQTFDQRPVLIIDDAHALSDITLQELLHYQKQLEKDQQTQLKILLLANKGIADTLEKISDIQHNQLYVQEMPAYTSKQTQAFIQHKIKIADYTGEPTLNDDDFQSIFKKSNGSPLSVMAQTVTHVEELARKKTKASGFQLKPAILLIGSVILICIAGFLHFYLNQTSLTEAPFEIAAVPTEQLQTENLTEVEKTISQQTNAMFKDKQNDSIESPEELQSKTGQPTETIEEKIIDNPSGINPAQTAVKTDTIKKAEKADDTEASTDISQPETEPVEEIKTKGIITENPTELTPSTLTEPLATVDEIKPVLETIKFDSSLQQLNQLGVHNKSWIMEQDATYWSLQIAAGRDPATLLYIAKRYRLTDNSAWYETQLTGKPWYVLLYGLYTSRDTANEAKKFLPGDLKSRKPFAKNFNAIQSSIR